MTTKYYSSLVLMLGIGLVGSSSAFGGGWSWDRDAGAKARGEFGPSSKTRSSPISACPSPAPLEAQAFSREPTRSVQFESGDVVVVTAENATLRVGNRVLTGIAKGQRLAVSAVQMPWIGTSHQANGQEVSGWLRMSDVTPLREPLATPDSVSRK
jgi:hypothetical protein